MRRLVFVVVALACTKPAPATSTVSAVDASIPPPRSGGVTPARTPEALERASHDLANAHEGNDDIAGALGGGGYLLFGATHDSAAQVDAFRSLVTRIKGLQAVALEQLSTEDDADLDEFFSVGDDAARARLRARQSSRDYAAWKFGYTAKIEDVIVAARGAGLPTLSCDLPPNALPVDTSDEARSRSRELHCAQAIAQKTSVALLVGANHAERSGLQTFLPSEALVRSVFFVGGRDPGFANGEAGRLVAITPVMLRLDDATSALLLPDSSSMHVTRVRDQHVPSNAPSSPAPLTLLVSSDSPGTFEASGMRAVVGAKGEWLSLRSTGYVFAFRTPGPIVMGGLEVPLGGWTELHLGSNSVEITEHEP